MSLRSARRSIFFTALLLAAGLSSGCASTADLDAIRQLAQEAKDGAERANRTAEEANRTASDAQRAASSAQQAAQAAQQCCNEVSQKLDRAFKKAVQK